MEKDTIGTADQENFVFLDDNLADSHDKKLVLDENTIILAAGDTYSIVDMDKLEEIVEKAGLSYQAISDKAGISISSIYKFFSRSSKNPTFYNVVQIFRAVGASVDELCGLRKKAPEPKPPSVEMHDKLIRLEDTVDKLNYTISVKDAHIADLIRQKESAEDLRDRCKNHFSQEAERQRQQHEAEIERLHARYSLQFRLMLFAIILLVVLLFAYMIADHILAGDWSLSKILFGSGR